jgi:hypothetical protein
MASPGAAGVAALVRQYFIDSNFWASFCYSGDNFCRAFTPSGMLIKAILLHSGSNMALFRGGSQPDTALGNAPDFFQVLLSIAYTLFILHTF